MAVRRHPKRYSREILESDRVLPRKDPDTGGKEWRLKSMLRYLRRFSSIPAGFFYWLVENDSPVDRIYPNRPG